MNQNPNQKLNQRPFVKLADSKHSSESLNLKQLRQRKEMNRRTRQISESNSKRKNVIAQKLPYQTSLSEEQIDSLNQCVEIIRLELAGGRRENPVPNSLRAKAAIDRYMLQFASVDTVDRETRLASVFGMRITNALESDGLFTVAQLLIESKSSLMERVNIGPSTVDEIRLTLAVYDLHLVGERPAQAFVMGN